MLKVGIYASCKNEEKHIVEWYNSCKDADYIVVSDTGSTDNSIRILSELNVHVTEMHISPWRFDFGFNFAMSLLPADTSICIRLDFDERLQPGWKDALLEAWTPLTTRLRYPYVWNWHTDGTPGRQWYSDRIHSRNGYYWIGHTHEGLCYRLPNEIETFTDKVKIYQYPDAKDKKDDLPRLIEAVGEWPHDARLHAYLAREYMYQHKPEKATEIYKKFLTMSCDKIERGLAMVNLSTTDPDNKEFWLKMAAFEIPTHREPLVHLAQYYYDKADWQNCYKNAGLALKITQHPMDYTCDPENWSWRPHDLMSIAAWNLGLYRESLDHSTIALDLNKTDKRLQSNLDVLKKFFIDNGISQDQPNSLFLETQRCPVSIE